MLGFLIIILILAICFVVLNKCKVFNTPYTGTTKQQVLIILFTGIYLLISVYKPIHYTNNEVEVDENNNIYNKYFVEAILHKRVVLDLEPSEELKNMENPYDYKTREADDIDYYFDTAYYNGKYYNFYGAVPAVLLFIPYTVITGNYLNTIFATWFFMILAVIVSTLLVIEIYKKWFKNVDFKMLFIAIVSMLMTGLYAWNSWRIYLYELMAVSGYFFIMLGMLMILKAHNHKDNNSKKLKYLFLSCFSMALSVGCRANLVFASILLIPFFVDMFHKEKAKNIIQMIIVIGIAYSLVAIPQMILNYARFDSIFEFGAKYQLTIADVTDLSDRYKDIPRAMYEYYLKPFSFKANFPFLTTNLDKTGYTSNFAKGYMLAGIFFMNINMFVLFTEIKYFKLIKDKLLKSIFITLQITGVLLSLVIVYYGGCIQRYVIDFYWMFAIASMILWFSIYESSTKHKKGIFNTFVILTMISFALMTFGENFTGEFGYFEEYRSSRFIFLENLFKIK